jgi:hypothetical protein
MGNSVGNPFSLSSTFGRHCSAKGRRIGILAGQISNWIFYSNRCRVNPNSGGALVKQERWIWLVSTLLFSAERDRILAMLSLYRQTFVRKVLKGPAKYGVVHRVLLADLLLSKLWNAKKYDLNTDRESFNGVCSKHEKDGSCDEADWSWRCDHEIEIQQEHKHAKYFRRGIELRYPGDKITLIVFTRWQIANHSHWPWLIWTGLLKLSSGNIFSNEALGPQLEATQYGVKVFGWNKNSVLKRIGYLRTSPLLRSTVKGKRARRGW